MYQIFIFLLGHLHFFFHFFFKFLENLFKKHPIPALSITLRNRNVDCRSFAVHSKLGLMNVCKVSTNNKQKQQTRHRNKKQEAETRHKQQTETRNRRRLLRLLPAKGPRAIAIYEWHKLKSVINFRQND